MSTTYRVRDFSQNFHKSQSRKVVKASWVAVPNKHDGKGFRRLMRLKDAAAIYGAWSIMLQVASKCPEQGTLADGDGPLTAEDLELKTGCPANAFEKAFAPLCEIGWLERVESAETGSALPVCSQAAPSTLHRDGTTGQDSTVQNRTNTVSAEPQTAAASAPASPTVLSFETTGKGPKAWSLTKAQVDDWQAAYPALDVLAECRKALAWTKANPGKRKTVRGMAGFLVRWLNKATDSPCARNDALFGGNGNGKHRPNFNRIANPAALRTDGSDYARFRSGSAPAAPAGG